MQLIIGGVNCKLKSYFLASSQVDQVELASELVSSLSVFLLDVDEEDAVTPGAVLVHVWHTHTHTQILLLFQDSPNSLHTQMLDINIFSGFFYIIKCVLSSSSTCKRVLSHSTLCDGSLAAVRRPAEVKPTWESLTKGAQCVHSLVTATLLLFLPSSMVSMTSSGLHTNRSVHPCRHMKSQGWAVLAARPACSSPVLQSYQLWTSFQALSDKCLHMFNSKEEP